MVTQTQKQRISRLEKYILAFKTDIENSFTIVIDTRYESGDKRSVFIEKPGEEPIFIGDKKLF